MNNRWINPALAILYILIPSAIGMLLTLITKNSIFIVIFLMIGLGLMLSYYCSGGSRE